MTPGGARERARQPGCPSDLALDELLAGDLAGLHREAELRGHVDGCASCGDRLRARAADPVLVPDAATARPLFEAEIARARTRRRTLWGGAVGAAAAAGAVLLFALADRGGGPTTRTKGGLALTVHVKRAATGAIDAISGSGGLRPGDEMRFSIAAAAPGYAVVLGLDAAPSVTVYVPGAAAAPPIRVEASGPLALPGSIVADAAAGFERVVAVVCDGAAAPEDLRQQAERALAAANGRPEAVTSLGTACREASVLLQRDMR